MQYLFRTACAVGVSCCAKATAALAPTVTAHSSRSRDFLTFASVAHCIARLHAREWLILILIISYADWPWLSLFRIRNLHQPVALECAQVNRIAHPQSRRYAADQRLVSGGIEDGPGGHFRRVDLRNPESLDTRSAAAFRAIASRALHSSREQQAVFRPSEIVGQEVDLHHADHFTGREVVLEDLASGEFIDVDVSAACVGDNAVGIADARLRQFGFALAWGPARHITRYRTAERTAGSSRRQSRRIGADKAAIRKNGDVVIVMRRNLAAMPHQSPTRLRRPLQFVHLDGLPPAMVDDIQRPHAVFSFRQRFAMRH